MVIERDIAIRSVHLDGIGIGCLEERAGVVRHSEGQATGVIADRAASAGLLDHAIVLDLGSAGDGNSDGAPTHLQVAGRDDHACATWESLCGGDGAGNWVRAGHELGSRRRRSEKSESDQRESRE